MFIPDNIHEYPDVSLGRGAIFTVPGKFNCTDNLLLVCGVFIPDNIHEYPDVSLGRGAIFTVPG